MTSKYAANAYAASTKEAREPTIRVVLRDARARFVGEIDVTLDEARGLRARLADAIAEISPETDDERAHITRAAVALDAHSFTDEPAVLARIHAALDARP